MFNDEFPALYELGRPDDYMTTIGDCSGAGIILVSGGNYSGKTMTLTAIGHEMKACSWNVIHARLPDVEKLPGLDSISAQSGSEMVKALSGSHRPDVLILNDIEDPALFRHAFQISEEGSLVVVGINALTSNEALDKFLGTLSQFHGLPKDYRYRIVLQVHQKFMPLAPSEAHTPKNIAHFDAIDKARAIFQEENSKRYYPRNANNYTTVFSKMSNGLFD